MSSCEQKHTKQNRSSRSSRRPALRGTLWTNLWPTSSPPPSRNRRWITCWCVYGEDYNTCICSVVLFNIYIFYSPTHPTHTTNVHPLPIGPRPAAEGPKDGKNTQSLLEPWTVNICITDTLAYDQKQNAYNPFIWTHNNISKITYTK